MNEQTSELDTFAIQYVAPDALEPHPKNAEIYKQDASDLVESVEKDGIIRPIHVSARSGLVLDGHRRLMAARRCKLSVVPTVVVPVDDEQEELRLLLSFNLQREKEEWERAGEYLAWRLLEELKAKERMAEGGRRGGRANSSKSPADSKGNAGEAPGKGVTNRPPPCDPPAHGSVAEDEDSPEPTVRLGKAVDLAAGRVGWSVGKAKRFDFVRTHSPKLAHAVLEGDLTVGKAHKQLKEEMLREAELLDNVEANDEPDEIEAYPGQETLRALREVALQVLRGIEEVSNIEVDLDECRELCEVLSAVSRTIEHFQADFEEAVAEAAEAGPASGTDEAGEDDE